MLVAVSLVELVSTLADHIRTQRHAFAAVFARPILRNGEQLRARAQAPLPFRHDQAIHFGAHFDFQQRVLAHVQPADDSILRRFGYEYSVLRQWPDSSQPTTDLRGARRISKLPAELRDPWRIARVCAPDLQFLLPAARRHLLYAAFRRSRTCTASLFNSRSAS